MQLQLPQQQQQQKPIAILDFALPEKVYISAVLDLCLMGWQSLWVVSLRRVRPLVQ